MKELLQGVGNPVDLVVQHVHVILQFAYLPGQLLVLRSGLGNYFQLTGPEFIDGSDVIPMILPSSSRST